MRHIDEFTIHRFRGIRDLKLEGLGQINLLVGDNNSGKTSVLEALSIFCEPLNVRRWLTVASMREVSISSLSQAERLIWLFPQRENNSNSNLSISDPEILLSALGDFSVEKVSARYEQFSEIVQVRYPRSGESGVSYEDRESEVEGVKIHVSSFIRRMQLALPGVSEVLSETLVLSNNRPLSVAKRQEIAILPLQIVNPSAHRLSTTPSLLWTNVVNAETKSDAIALLRFFDNSIQDVDIILGYADRPTVSVKHEKLGRAPLSTFGDGLRRVFTLAGAIPGARGGLLLVDELETAIHTRALEKTFDWLVKACVQNNVQLFATTHSLEAVDAVLEASDESVDLVAYRLQKAKGQTTTTRFNKKLLTRLRENLGREIR